jgi:hypothetical protein
MDTPEATANATISANDGSPGKLLQILKCCTIAAHKTNKPAKKG